MHDSFKFGDRANAEVIRGGGTVDKLKPFRGVFRVECFDKDGNLKWEAEAKNLVTNAGEDYALDVALSAGSQITTWYIGITNGSPSPAETDTMSSHAGWTENQNYSEGVRQTFVDGGVSGQSLSNSASKASFSINAAAQTIGGMFLTSSDTKGGTTGTLWAAGAFAEGNKSAGSGDTINVTYTCTAGGA